MTAVNFYEDIKANPDKFRQLSCKGLLFAHYSCPQVDLKQEFYSQCNFISYTFSGKKRIHKNGKSWYLEKDVAIFARKGAYMFEKFENVEHCVMVFFLPDAYLQKILAEYATQLTVKTKSATASDAIVKLDIGETTKMFFQSMISYFHEPPPEHLLELKFRELLLNILTNAGNSDLLHLLQSVQYTGKPSLEEVMEDNYLFNLTLEDFARIALRSLPTLKGSFRPCIIPPRENGYCREDWKRRTSYCRIRPGA